MNEGLWLKSGVPLEWILNKSKPSNQAKPEFSKVIFKYFPETNICESYAK